MFSLVRALPSPASAEDCSPLFGWFIGTTAQSDFSGACMLALWLWAFANRSRSCCDRDAPEISRFSCMLFLSVPGFLDYAGPTGHSRSTATGRIAFLVVDRVQRPNSGFFEARSPGPPIPLSTLQPAPRDARRKTRGQDGFALSFLVGLFHSQQHAGLSRRTYDKPVICHYRHCRRETGIPPLPQELEIGAKIADNQSRISEPLERLAGMAEARGEVLGDLRAGPRSRNCSALQLNFTRCQKRYYGNRTLPKSGPMKCALLVLASAVCLASAANRKAVDEAN